MTAATAPLCGHPLPTSHWCDLPAGHRGLHAAQLCGHRWDADCAVWASLGHGCEHPPTHPGPCRCRCGATTTRERTDHA